MRRPQPNPRRGLLRAGLTVLVLIILAIGVVALASSLAAPSAKAPGTTPVATAPTAPNTPGPLSTPSAAATPASTPKATVKPKKHKDVSERLSLHRSGSVMESLPYTLVHRMAETPNSSESSRHGSLVASFRDVPRWGSSAQLVITDRATGKSTIVSKANPFVRPVWSRDGGKLLFVADSSIPTFPGARWTLEQYDLHTDRSTHLATQDALDMEPLGWYDASPMFSVATQPDTSLSTVVRGRARHVGILMPQIITQPRLSPDSRYVAFVAPTNCRTNCTLDLFEQSTQKLWVGPTGVASSSALAWSRDGRFVVSDLNGKLALTDARTQQTLTYVRPAHLPVRWPHEFTATVGPRFIRLVDTVSGETYFTSRSGSR